MEKVSKIKEVVGDLIEMAEKGNFDVILHQANCHGVFGGGIALQLATQYPEVIEADRTTKRSDRSKLGSISYCHINTKESNFTIVNCYGQYNLGPKEHDYNALRSCLKEVKSRFAGKRLGMPKLACGLAGADYTIVKQIIEEELGEEDVTVVIWKYEPSEH